MKMKRSKLSLAIALPVLFSALPTFAQEETVEEVVVVGSRGAPRTVSESPVPVDVLKAEDIARSGSSDMLELLRNSIPSLNTHDNPISDAASMIRPMNLRGLSSDSTLILLNGKRRHRASVIAFQGGGINDGAQGPDISVIPSVALKQVEVLRDGAAAQYGSDAIAGVMNFVLNDSAEGGKLEVKQSEYFEGDGTSTTVAGNIGMPMTDAGFLNLSFQVKNVDDTSRSVQRPDAAALIAAGNTAVPTPAQVWGSPKIDDDVTFFANFGLDLGNGSEVYAFGNYSERDVDGGFYYRNPDGRGGVYTQGSDRLVGDLTQISNPASTYCVDTYGANVDPSDYALRDAIMADANCFLMNEVAPGGYTPRFVGNIADTSFTAGRRGEMKDGYLEGWNYDISGSVGRNEADFGLNNTVNPSFGPDTPRNFKTGSYIQLEKTFNVDLQKQYDNLSVATGYEWREDTFEIIAGEGASWQAGPLALQGFNVGSHGFAGFSIDSAGAFTRRNYALYVDVENQVNDALLLGAAVRYEDFNTFGDTINYKLVFNFQMTDELALRGSHSTGFRAPTQGQANVVNTQTSLVGGQLTQAQTLPAPKLGEAELQPEESRNFAVGLVYTGDSFSLTADYYDIKVDDRIALTDNATPTNAQRAAMAAAGVPNPELIGQVNYFTNDFDTETKGLDVVATWDAALFDGNTAFSLAYNFTETEVTNTGATVSDCALVNGRGEICKKIRLEEGLPNHRATFTVAQDWESVNAFVRVNYYGGYLATHADWFGEMVGSDITVDLEMNYMFDENLTLTAGASNLFDQEAARIDGSIVGEPDNVLGGVYYETSPFSINGGIWYLKASYSF